METSSGAHAWPVSLSEQAHGASLCFMEMLVEMSVLTQDVKYSARWYVLRLNSIVF